MIVDLDLKRSPAQQQLVKKYCQGYVPRVTTLDRNGKPVYDSPGEVDESKISGILGAILK